MGTDFCNTGVTNSDQPRLGLVSLSKSEHILYAAGIRRGHAECLRQLANQLREAGKQMANTITSGSVFDALQRAVAGYEGIAAQLDGPAAAAAAEQQKLLDQHASLKATEQRSIYHRFRAAVHGAALGWRS